MQGVTIIAVGRCKDKHWKDAACEYAKRLSAFCKLNIIELDSKPLPANQSPAIILQGMDAEGECILQKIPEHAFIVALCVEGKGYDSENFAQILENAAQNHSKIVFIIGGSHGISKGIKQLAHCKLSMSEMTFPHQLARVMLLEQIYRGYTIISGHKYHK